MPPKGWKKPAVTGPAKPAPEKTVKTRKTKLMDASQSKPMSNEPREVMEKKVIDGTDRYESHKLSVLLRENLALLAGFLVAPNMPAELAQTIIQECTATIKDITTIRQVLMGTPTPPAQKAYEDNRKDSPYATHSVEIPAPGSTVMTTTMPVASPPMPPPPPPGPAMGGSGFVPTLPGVPMRG
jgi:hypothetical protein